MSAETPAERIKRRLASIKEIRALRKRAKYPHLKAQADRSIKWMLEEIKALKRFNGNPGMSIGNIPNLKKRYNAVLLTLADLRSDPPSERDSKMIGRFQQKASDLREAIRMYGKSQNPRRRRSRKARRRTRRNPGLPLHLYRKYSRLYMFGDTKLTFGQWKKALSRMPFSTDAQRHRLRLKVWGKTRTDPDQNPRRRRRTQRRRHRK